MRTVMAMVMSVSVLAAMGCGGGSSDGSSPVAGNWIYESADATKGLALDFDASGGYVAALLGVTSSTTANGQVEVGTYDTAGTNLTFIPEKSTCTGPDPVYSYMYSISGTTLALTDNTGAISLTRNTAPADSTFVITYGCFDSSGNFTKSSLAPISN